MEKSLNIEQVRSTVKTLLKKRGATYQDLGKVLGLTLPAIKRLMTKGDFSLTRLEIIAQWCGLTLFELMEIAKRQELAPYQFTEKQEAFLSQNPRALYLFLLLGAALPIDECIRRMDMPKKQMQKILFSMDRFDLIEIGREGNVRVLYRGPYLWIQGGELQKRFHAAYLHQISKLLFTRPGKDDMQITYELYLSDRLFTQMKDELRTTFQKYQGLSRIEHELHSAEEIFPVSGAILANRFDSWRGVLMKGDN